MRPVAVHYPVRPGNGPRSVRPVGISVLPIAYFIFMPGLYWRIRASAEIYQ
jgi:hypothetical protein